MVKQCSVIIIFICMVVQQSISDYRNYIVGGGGGNGLTNLPNCNSTGTCIAGSNTGCFRINSADGNYAFCGQSSWPQTMNLSFQLANLVSNYATSSSVGSPIVNTQCQSSNVNAMGNCYCSNGDFCNDSGSTQIVPETFAFLMCIIAAFLVVK